MIKRELRFTAKIYVLLLISAIVNSISFSQNLTHKKAGICFRTDDNQPIARYIEYASLFNKYNKKFTFALNLGRIEYDYPDSYNYYLNSVREIQSHGHEMMDHTPWHRTSDFITFFSINDYLNKPGVHKVNGNKVELEYEDVNLINSKHTGYVNIDSNIVISLDADFGNFEKRDCYLYFPSIKKLVFINEVDGWINSNKVKVMDFWKNKIDLDTIKNVKYYSFDYDNVHLTTDAIKVLAEESVKLADHYNLIRPYSWIQPGGYHPHSYRNEVKQAISGELGFKSAGIFPDPSLKVFNEYNPDNDKQFGINFGDFRDDIWTLEACKTYIADNIAKHHVVFGENHFTWGSDGLLGGWSGFLDRIEKLIQWTISKNIPIRTYAEWADTLYNSTPDPTENIFPELNIDLDENSIADGFENLTNTILDKSDSPDSTNYSLKTSGKNTIAQIKNLGGIEKGENYFEIWTKGSTGNFIEVDFKIGSDHRIFKFSAENTEWTKYDLTKSINGNTILNIPDNISLLDVTVRCSNYSSGDVKVGGMKLFKTSYLSVDKSTINFTNSGEVQNINITSNNYWNIEESLNWLDISDYSGIGNKKISLNCYQNYSTNPREGKIKIYYSNHVEEILIYQSGAYPIIYTSPDTISVSSDTSTSVIHVISNTDWTTNINADWIMSSPSTGSGDVDIKLNIEKNQLFETRDAIIKVKYNEEIFKSIYIHQNAREEILSVSKDSLYFISDSSKIGLQIESNTSWSIITEIPWLKISKENGSANDSIFIETSENKSLDSRTGIVSISTLTKKIDVFVSQNGESPTLSLSLDTLTFDADSSKISFEIFTNLKWKIENKHEWITFKPDSGTGNQRVEIHVKENLDTLIRKVNFVIKSSYFDRQIGILQHARQMFNIHAYSDSVKAGEILGNGKYKKGETVTLTAIPNSGWKLLNWTEENEIISTDSILTFTATEQRTLKVNFEKIKTNINEDSNLSDKFYLFQNYPNPFNPSTKIKYSIPTGENKIGEVNLIIFDILGKEVEVLVNEFKSPGNYEVQFDASNLSSGIYYCRLTYGKMIQLRKLLLIK